MQDSPLPLNKVADASATAIRPTRLIAYAWGEKYLEELLSLTLPAVLAPNNLPYVASTVPCEVVLLIEERWRWHVTHHPTVERIGRICPVRLLGLDDLIAEKDKYGMALTYALHRGFTDLAEAVTDSYLLFLNADFVVADGSLRQVLGALMRGERLVAAPSYCVVSRTTVPELRSCADPDSGVLSIAPRELAKLALRNLHATVRGKTLNQSKFHLRQMDQFYWQLDTDTLLGHQMPIAIVGMRPECHLGEPNAYWDHGLIREFCPLAEPCVLGDSDDFLMVELREREVAREQIVAGPADPKEVAERMIGWVTPYQRDFAKYPLTLHSKDLTPSVAAGRDELASCVQEILDHSPRVLPSHRDHPQWNYHLSAFMEARHRYLSTRLGSATATDPPPPTSLSLDRTWWRLDGLKKKHERMRAELESARDAHVEMLQGVMTQASKAAQARQGAINRRFMNEFPSGQAAPQSDGYYFRRSLDGFSPPAASDCETGAGHEVLQRYKQEFTAVQRSLDDEIARLNKMVQALREDYERDLRELDRAAEAERFPLEREYRRATQRRAVSAAIPQVRVLQGADSPSRPRATSALVWRHALMAYYRRPLGRVRQAVALAVAGGARNVLVVAAETSILKSVVAEIPGARAYVTSAQVRTGNLWRAFDGETRFDVCVWELDSRELAEFAPLSEQVKPVMNAGGAILGFHWNIDRIALPIDAIRAANADCARVTAKTFPRHINGFERSRLAVAARQRLPSPRKLLGQVRRALRRIAAQTPAPCSTITIEMYLPLGARCRLP
jgi:hypothetical protein